MLLRTIPFLLPCLHLQLTVCTQCVTAHTACASLSEKSAGVMPWPSHTLLLPKRVGQIMEGRRLLALHELAEHCMAPVPIADAPRVSLRLKVTHYMCISQFRAGALRGHASQQDLETPALKIATSCANHRGRHMSEPQNFPGPTAIPCGSHHLLSATSGPVQACTTNAGAAEALGQKQQHHMSAASQAVQARGAGAGGAEAGGRAAGGEYCVAAISRRAPGPHVAQRAELAARVQLLHWQMHYLWHVHS